MNKKLSPLFSGVVRPAKKDELWKIMTLERNCFPVDQWSAKDMRPYLKESLRGDKTFLSLAFATAAGAEKPETPAVGYVLGAFEDDKTGEVIGMAVDESCRGQKLGQILLEKTCKNLHQAGADKIILQVRKENAVAIHLYEKAGFTKTQDLPHHYPPADESIGTSGDGIEMARFYTGGPLPT